MALLTARHNGLEIFDAQWRPVNRRPLFPQGDWILDQDSIGSCVAESSSMALRKCRFLAGATDEPLSPGCLYAQVNGGRDSGAVITDALDALKTKGTCLFSTVGQKPFYLDEMPQAAWTEALRFRIEGWWYCDTFDEVATAVQLGPPYIPVFGIMVGNNFQSFDPYGVAGHASGPGNHAVHADGMTQLADGRWVLDMPNSWGAAWGPWHNGRVYLDEQHLDAGGDQPAGYVIQAAIEDPQDPLKPPSAS
jgi:hypothetical protein